ncbi:MAG: FAD-dependent oxidoreductase [Hyphomicrobiales bacterium]|nr:MAG: FAD-dependent oxidoreductase [Hyphomicrobiales bacterium]
MAGLLIGASFHGVLLMSSSSKDYATDAHGWAELLAPRTAKPALKGKHRAAFTVIGAGVTGLSCARRLAELHPDQEILLLEARDIGQGASGRNSGFAVSVSHFFSDNLQPPLAAQIDDYRRINRANQAGLELLREQVSAHSIDCQWRDDGFYHVAADEISKQECGYLEKLLQRMEIKHHVHDREALNEKLGTRHYHSGIHVPGGVLLQPAALVQGLADSLPKNVTLCEQSAVLSISNRTPITLQLEAGEVQTDKLFIATNYEAPKLGVLNRYMIGSTLTGSVTRVLGKDELASLGSLSHWGSLSLHRGGATVRLTTDGRICLRNTAEYNGAKLFDDQTLVSRQRVHREAFEKRYPQLADVPFEYSWSGVEGISANGTNFFGQQETNIYYAGVFNGSGVSRGTAFGTALAEYACDGQSSLIDDCLAFEPATWLPPRPLLDIGAWFTVRSRFKGVGLDR